jgi:hypothetical protein
MKWWERLFVILAIAVVIFIVFAILTFIPVGK